MSSAVSCSHEFDIHEDDICHCFPWGQLRKQWQRCTWFRGILSLFLLIFLLAIVSGKLGPPIWNWIRVTLAFASCMALFIIATVPDHFLEDHLWKHVVKIHVPRVFLWTLGALLLMNFLLDQFHFEIWLRENQLIVLLLANLFQNNPWVDTFIGTLSGAAAAGNPVVSYLLGGELLQHGVSLYAVSAFVLSWVTLGFIQLPVEAGVLGARFTFYRNILAFFSTMIIAVMTTLTLRMLT